MAERRDVYIAIDTERDYQNFKWNQGQPECNPHTITEWLSYIQYYTQEGLAKQTVSHVACSGLPWLRKIAALAVVGMEQHGAPQRDGFER